MVQLANEAFDKQTSVAMLAEARSQPARSAEAAVTGRIEPRLGSRPRLGS